MTGKTGRPKFTASGNGPVTHTNHDTRMKLKNYRGWKLYKTRSGSNLRLRSIKASHPKYDTRPESVINESEKTAVEVLKKEIDAIEGGAE